jgi:hypothetical protein
VVWVSVRAVPLPPPADLRKRLHAILEDLLQRNPAATSSESYVQHHVEFELLAEKIEPRYSLRIGINYHGAQVQHVTYDANGVLVGWNPSGNALGTGARAKVLLAGATIFPRDLNEQMMSDCKIGGGNVPAGQYVRTEFKVRGWLGKTKNLDGAQLLKDFRLLRNDQADLLVIALSEVAHLKWRGEGPPHQVERRTGCVDFRKVLLDPAKLPGTSIAKQDLPEMEIETLAELGEPAAAPQHWRTSTQRVVGSPASNMPGAEHLVTLCWRV